MWKNGNGKRRRMVAGKWLAGILAVALFVSCPALSVRAEVNISAPSAVLVEASTGEFIYEKNSAERRSPASITKIMTLLLTFEQLDAGKIHLNDEVVVYCHDSDEKTLSMPLALLSHGVDKHRMRVVIEATKDVTYQYVYFYEQIGIKPIVVKVNNDFFKLITASTLIDSSITSPTCPVIFTNSFPG